MAAGAYFDGENAEEKERDAERRSAAASALVAVSPEISQKSGVTGEGSYSSSEKSTDVAVELRRLASNSVSVARAEREDSEEKEKEAVRLAAMAVKLAQSTLSEAEENKKEKRKVVLLVRPESQARLTKILDEIEAQFEAAEAEVKAKEQQIAARGGSIAFSDNGVIQGGPRKIASASASANRRTLQISRRDSIPVPTQASIETVSSKSRSTSPVRPQGKGCAVRLTSVDGGRYPAEKRSFFNMFCTVPCFFLYSPLKRTHDTHKNHSLIYSTEEVLFDKDTESIFENNQVTTVKCIALTLEFYSLFVWIQSYHYFHLSALMAFTSSVVTVDCACPGRAVANLLLLLYPHSSALSSERPSSGRYEPFEGPTVP